MINIDGKNRIWYIVKIMNKELKVFKKLEIDTRLIPKVTLSTSLPTVTKQVREHSECIFDWVKRSSEVIAFSIPSLTFILERSMILKFII